MLPENQQAPPKQDPDNCEPIASCGHRDPKPSCPGSCKGSHYTSPPPPAPPPPQALSWPLVSSQTGSLPLGVEEMSACFPDEVFTSVNNALVLSCIDFALQLAFLCA